VAIGDAGAYEAVVTVAAGCVARARPGALRIAVP